MLHPTGLQVPNIMSYLKSSTQSAASTSTAAATIPEPRKNVNRDSQQVHAAVLASYGIKVRDFAFESTLPPVRPVRLLQIQPEPRPMKRIRDGEEGDVFFQNSGSQDGEGGSSKKQKLGREVTEPDIQPAAAPPTRARGFANLADYDHSLESQLIQSQQTEWSQPPLQYDDESQESEPYIDTPIVTPNGSLQWRVIDNSNIPESQLDTESQANAPELLSYSQLGLPQPDFSQQETSQSEELSPLKLTQSSSSVLSSPPSSPIPPPQDFHPGPSSRAPHYPSPLRYSSTTRRSSNPSPEQYSSHVSPPIQTPRYHLRKRPSITASSPTKSSARGRAVRGTHLSSRPPAFTMQSSHSQMKAKTANGSPNARTLRTRTIIK